MFFETEFSLYPKFPKMRKSGKLVVPW
ncbi:hypothetical protein CAEBREN_01855 [Caenorhabditis brenneri]|uniref:Uncharacterized protein n=1 Tax=Caenorhabditis brenneri TaxID=135651 RepID=G0P7D5_CAEBE|nr:hypothetical protein CAEBREN_01855 [Caenorhabditis brenneri]